MHPKDTADPVLYGTVREVSPGEGRGFLKFNTKHSEEPPTHGLLVVNWGHKRWGPTGQCTHHAWLGSLGAPVDSQARRDGTLRLAGPQEQLSSLKHTQLGDGAGCQGTACLIGRKILIFPFRGLLNYQASPSISVASLFRLTFFPLIPPGSHLFLLRPDNVQSFIVAAL